MELNFDDLAPIEVPVRISGKRYVLMEASEEAARQYRNARMRCHRLDDGKLVQIGDIGDLQSLLVSQCLWEEAGGKLRKVHLDVVRSWLARIVKPLFDKAMEISPALQEDAVTEGTLEKRITELQTALAAMRAEKNLRNGSTATSASPENSESSSTNS